MMEECKNPANKAQSNKLSRVKPLNQSWGKDQNCKDT